jgi:hypothetical protein
MLLTCRSDDSSGRLTEGRTYLVLAMLLASEKNALLVLIVDDAQSPTWFETNQFETASDLIPENWVVRIGSDGAVHLAPAAWLEEGFWDRFYHGPDALEARRLFRSELARIKASQERA